MTAAEHLLKPGLPLDRRFYARPVCAVAIDLLGTLLYRRTPDALVGGRIVEVEAYMGADDPASHAFRGPTKRNASMFGPAGHAYIYTIHARFCMNVVAEQVGIAHAILIRAVEPLVGVEVMRRRRSVDNLRDLARGPARLCEAFALDRRMDGWDLTTGQELWLADDGRRPSTHQIAVTPRIGVTSAQESLLRYIVAENPFVSGPARLRNGQALTGARPTNSRS